MILSRTQITSLLSNGVLALAGFASFLVLSRGVEPALFGTWVLFIALSTVVDLVRFGLTRAAAVRIIARSDNVLDQHLVNAAGLKAGLYIVFAIAALFYALYGLGQGLVKEEYLLFLLWYPLLAVSNLLWNNGLTFLQARSKFGHTIALRLVSILPFVLFNLWQIKTGNISFESLAIAFIASNVLASLFSFFMGWDSVKHYRRVARKDIRELMSFGKWAMASMLGSSLLKSADTFIISLSPVFGVLGVALYAIPFKIVEMLEQPIRSVATVGYNELSRAAHSGSMERVKVQIARSAKLMLILTLPVIVFIAFFPDFVLNLLGGSKYAGWLTEMRTMLYILLIYGVLLTYDRITGITLEAVGRPELNTYKVLLMVFLNVVGDLIAVFYFESLIGVVIASVFFVFVGVLVGYYYIHKITKSGDEKRV